MSMEGTDQIELTYGSRDEEGFSRTFIMVRPNDEHDTREYLVDIFTSSRDCDGPLSTSKSFVVRPRRGKRRRWYHGSRWAMEARGEKRGKFGLRSAFVVVGEVEASQRDAFAEAAGY